MDFYGFIYDVSTYLSVDFEVRRQLVSDFVEKKTANYRKLSQQLKANCFFSILQLSNERCLPTSPKDHESEN